MTTARMIKNLKADARTRATLRRSVNNQVNNSKSVNAIENEDSSPDYSQLAGFGLLYSNGTLNIQQSLIIENVINDMALPLIKEGTIDNTNPLLLDLSSFSADQITLHLSGEFENAIVYLQMNNNDPTSTVNANWLNVRKITLNRNEYYNRTIKCSALGYRFVIDSVSKNSTDSGVFGKLGGIF